MGDKGDKAVAKGKLGRLYQATVSDEADQTTDSAVQDATETHTTSDPNVLSTAKTFLSRQQVADASLADKARFLRSKGLTEQEIETLLEPASTSAINISSTPSPVPDPSPTRLLASDPPIAESMTPPNPTPPIITYPEFLLRPKHAPLVTPTRLLNSIYAFSALGATIYGLSRFVIEPMVEKLSSARHDMYEYTEPQLHALNQRLEKSVSSDPLDTSERQDPHEADDMIGPTPISAQTNRNTESADTSDESDEKHALTSTCDAQTKTTNTLSSTLSDLLSASESEAFTAQTTQDAIQDLKMTVDGILYRSSLRGHVGAFTKNVNESSGSRTDTSALLKTEIRSVKGLLLGARSLRGGIQA